ncbi:maltotransferase domain-containing protein, partial [Rhodococcus sp. CX]|uniref:maltotransferase domain-containing protein n=3 Tax=unclassified Rhodococcus (in: high G+C Gram-positive bacteria) TaxID=192944 RepID=UPI0027DD9C28
MTGRLAIDDVQPQIAGGRYPVKAVVGEVVPVSAVVWREGHDAVAATLAVRGPGTDPETEGRLVRIPMVPGTMPDTFHATFTPTSPGTWNYRV